MVSVKILRESKRNTTKKGGDTDMAKKVIVAKFTHEGKEYVGKREVKMYDEGSKVDELLLRDANQGLTLRTQTAVRNAVKQKYGLSVVSAGGENVDLSAVETV